VHPQARIVPLIVEHDTFWRRYFYRLHLLREADAQRAGLAARASAPPEEEVLSIREMLVVMQTCS
jgi:BSD domain